MATSRIKKISRNRDNTDLIRTYNWGFLRINPQYRNDYTNLVNDIFGVLGDSSWRNEVEKSYFAIPVKSTLEVENLCKAFQRKWRVSLPANPNLDLPVNVSFKKITEAVVAVSTPEQLSHQQEILSLINSMTKVSYKNKTREKESWSEKNIYALMLVDLRWSNEQDIIKAYRSLKANAFNSDKISKNFSILEWKVKLMLSHSDTFLNETPYQIAQLYSKFDTTNKTPRNPEDFRRESIADKKKFNQFMMIAPLIPFNFRTERVGRKK